ncbi:hypothetical protein MMC17_000697 [Xylographa soralifera]|nr:hypothetical protein [Xylographa soralifera]
MSASTLPWTWSQEHNDYYYAELQIDGEWKYTFQKSQNAPTSPSGSSSRHVPRSVPSTSGSVSRPSAVAVTNYHPTQHHPQAHANQEYVYSRSTAATNQITAGVNNLTVSRTSDSGQSYQYTHNQGLLTNTSRPPQVHTHRTASATGEINYAPLPRQGGARPPTSHALSASAVPFVHPGYSTQQVGVSSNRIGKQVSQASTSGTAYTQLPFSSQGPSGSSYSYTSTGIQVDEIGSDYRGDSIMAVDVRFDRLDPSFQKMSNEAEWKFFVPGRVFATLLWQSEGSELAEGISFRRYGEVDGERAYAKVYRCIVITARTKQHYSKCIRISTYSGQGAAKRGLNQKSHCMLFTGDVAPSKLINEKMMNKEPIQMIPVNQTEKLDPKSRTDLAKTFPVEHNVKVKEIGMISSHHLKRLVQYVKECQ